MKPRLRKPPAKPVMMACFAAVMTGAAVLTMGQIKAGITNLAMSVTQAVSPSGLSLVIHEVDASDFPQTTARVAVVDTNRQPVAGLGPADFEVHEDGKRAGPIEVSPVVHGEEPLTVVLAVDTSGSMDAAAMETAKEAAAALVNALGPHDHIGLVAFSTKARVVQGLTQDKAAVLHGLSQLRPEGNAALYDALFSAVETVRSGGAGRKVVVLNTDGVDTQSLGALEDGLRLARQGGVAVHTIGIGADVDRGAITRMAGSTGGYAVYAPTLERIEPAFRAVSNHLRQQYLVRYASPQPKATGVHKLGVRVNQWFRGAGNEATFEANLQEAGDIVPSPDVGARPGEPARLELPRPSFEGPRTPSLDSAGVGAVIQPVIAFPVSVVREVQGRLLFIEAIPEVVRTYQRYVLGTVVGGLHSVALWPLGLFEGAQGRLLFIQAIPGVFEVSWRLLMVALLLPVAAIVAIRKGREMALIARERLQSSPCPDCGGRCQTYLGGVRACRVKDVLAAEENRNLGSLLVESGLLSPELLAGYIDQSVTRRQPLKTVLREAGAVAPEQLSRAEFYLERSNAISARKRGALKPDRVTPWWVSRAVLSPTAGVFLALCAGGMIAMPLLVG